MKKFIYMLILVSVICMSWRYRSDIHSFLIYGYNQISPCSQPVEYHIAEIDPKFHLTKTQVTHAIHKATSMWEAQNGSALFRETPGSGIAVSFEYDYRQEATDTLKKLGVSVDASKDNFSKLQSTYTDLTQQHDDMKAVYESKLDRYTQEIKVYEDQVSYWNSRGGAPQAEFNKLQNTHRSLIATGTSLQTSVSLINQKVSEINALAVTLNRLASELNLTVKKYNEIGQSRGSQFEEGEYTANFQKQAIHIFEFSSSERLTRVLTHEFGHALGLEHVQDPSAIMYYLNQGSVLALSSDDISEFKRVCRKR